MPLLRRLVPVAAAAALAGCSGSDTPDSGVPDAGQSSSIGFETVASAGEESEAAVRIPVVLSEPFRESTAVVDVVVRGTAGGDGEDYTLSQARVSVPPGQLRATVDLDVISDGFDEPDETIELSLANPRTSGGDTLTVGANQTHRYTIRAQNTAMFPTLSFSSQSSTHPESSTAVTLTIALSRPSTTSVQVTYARTGGTATPTADFNTFSAGTLTFAPGVTSQTITLSPRDDAFDEEDETVVIALSNPVGEVMLGGATTHTILLADDDPAPTLQFSAPTQAVSEGIVAPSVPVTLSAVSGRTVTVGYSVTGGTATGSGVDYALNAGTLTFPAGSTSRSIPINLVDDPALEGSENVLISLGPPEGALLGANGTLDLTILDNDVQPTVAFASPTASAAEGSGSAGLTVALSNPYNAAVSVSYSVTGGTATAGVGGDYTLSAGTLVLPAGTTTGTITLSLLNDGTDEDDETVVVTLNTPVNASLGTTTTQTFTITDDDAPPVVSFSSNASQSSEGAAAAGLAVALAPASARTVIVSYSVTGGTATGGGTDYTLATGTLTFSPGVTLQNVPLSVAGDALDEDNETVVVTLSSPGNATLGTIPVHTFTITDDDAPPTVGFAAATSSQPESVGSPPIPVVLSAPSGRTVRVSYSATGGTASGSGTGADYSLPGGMLTFDPGVTSLDVPISVVGDTTDEAGETVQISLTGPVNATLSATTAHTFTIADDDPAPTVQFAVDSSSGGEGTTAASATVTLSNASAQVVTVAYSVTGGTATGGNVDYSATAGTITFPAGTTSRPLGFSVVNDSLNEANETIVFTLASPTNATLGTPASHTYTISDNDPLPTLQFQVASSSSGEASGQINLLATLSPQSGQTVSVTYEVTGGTAAGGGGDYTFTPGTLTFSPGNTSQNVPITIEQDAVDEDNETVVLALSAPVNAALGTNQGHTLTILDDDPLPVVRFTSGSSSGAESVGLVTLDVVLAPASARTVTVNYSATGGTATGGGTDYTLQAGSLTFMPGETTASIGFSVTGDGAFEPNETIVISLSVPAPPTAALGSPANYTYTIVNDD
jgi:hypothetical protein